MHAPFGAASVKTITAFRVAAAEVPIHLTTDRTAIVPGKTVMLAWITPPEVEKEVDEETKFGKLTAPLQLSCAVSAARIGCFDAAVPLGNTSFGALG